VARRSRSILLGAGGAWLALAGCLADRLAEGAVDDFYITYRYAWNLLHGLGFVFNPGERVYGLTDPGYGLLLAGAAFLTRVTLPSLGTFLTGFALVGIALAVLAEALRRDCFVPEALFGGTLVVLSSCLWVNQGAGVFWALLLLVVAAEVAGKTPLLAGALGGLALWMRPDAVLGLGALGLLLWRERRRPSPDRPPIGVLRAFPWRFALPALLVAGSGAAWVWSYFGTIVPNTLGAKQGIAAGSHFAWAGIAGFWARLEPVLPRHWGPAWPWIALAGGVGQLAFTWRSGRVGRTLAAYSLALAIAYPLLGVPFSFWYVVPTFVAALYGLVYLGGAGGRWIAARVRPAERARSGPLAAGLAALLLAPLLLSLVPANLEWLRGFEWQRHLITYRAAALWLRDESAAADDVAYVEIGVLGYYSRRTVVDLLGLVTPSSVPYAREGDRRGAFLAHPTRWVVFHSRGGMGPITSAPWFARAYEERARFHEDAGKELILYRRYPDGKVPPPRPPHPPHPAGSLGDRARPGRHRGGLGRRAAGVADTLPGALPSTERAPEP
jgi:hypothetical protein